MKRRSMMTPVRLTAQAGMVMTALVGGGTPRAAAAAADHAAPLDLAVFHVIPRESGPVNYYKLVPGADPYIHAAYKPPLETTVLGYELPERQRHAISAIEWKWRATTLPRGGNECAEGKGDSAAVVYVTWRRGLKWYSVKYVWSAVGPKGETCDAHRSVFSAQDTVVVDSGPPLNVWRGIRIDPDKEFRNHFAGGDPHAEVPDLVGLGIMTDGDQTASESSADYGGFVLVDK